MNIKSKKRKSNSFKEMINLLDKLTIYTDKTHSFIQDYIKYLQSKPCLDSNEKIFIEDYLSLVKEFKTIVFDE